MVPLDDLDTGEVWGRLFGKPHHENGADREVGHDETTRTVVTPEAAQVSIRSVVKPEVPTTAYIPALRHAWRLVMTTSGSVDSKTTSPTTAAWSVVIEGCRKSTGRFGLKYRNEFHFRRSVDTSGNRNCQSTRHSRNGDPDHVRRVGVWSVLAMTACDSKP